MNSLTCAPTFRPPSPAPTAVVALWPIGVDPTVVKQLAHWYRTLLTSQSPVPTTTVSYICQPPLLALRTRP